MDGFDRQRLVLRLEDVRKGAGDHAHYRITGRAGHDQPRVAARSEDEGAVDRAVIDGRPGRVFRGVDGEPKGSRPVREGRREMLQRRRRRDEPDLDVVWLRILDGGSDEPDQRHQNQQPTDQRRQDRLGPCPIHGINSTDVELWRQGDHQGADATAASRSFRKGMASEQGIWLATMAPAWFARCRAVAKSMPRSRAWVKAARNASPAPSPLTTAIFTGAASRTRSPSKSVAPSPPRFSTRMRGPAARSAAMPVRGSTRPVAARTSSSLPTTISA